MPGEIRPATPALSKRIFVGTALAFILILLAVANPAPIKAAWEEIERIILLKSDPVSASPAKLSEHEIEGLDTMQPQQQAERLLERATNHYEGANELIAQYVDRWYGRLDMQRLSGPITTALNSNDLRVRAAAIEIELAGNNLRKDSTSVNELLSRIENEPDARPWGLWLLGMLGNRGVEPERIFDALLGYRHDPVEDTRKWAIEGLSLLATDETIEPMLDAFQHDASPAVRERAACGLAQSGMYTRAQRLRAVPQMLNMMDDPTVDQQTRGWVFQALRDITGAAIGPDPNAWRAWWSDHGQR